MIENTILLKTADALKHLYGFQPDMQTISIQKTRKEFEGDFTLVVFPFVKHAKKSPQITAEELGLYLQNNIETIERFNVIQGFLNIKLKDSYWTEYLKNSKNSRYADRMVQGSSTYVVEYSSPNTNKPLHLGHIRNNLLGYAVAEILKITGHKVYKVNLVNDRGIHICKSMLAWRKWGHGETPQSIGIKGDFLVGKYYVLFETKYKEEIKSLISKGMNEEEATKNAPLIKEAQMMLQQWEQNNKDIRELWQMMNTWVLDGFDTTYQKLGIDFDKTYFESDTYLLGKKIINEGLSKNIFLKKSDNSVWIDLKDKGLDEKLLLRGDGTSVYITQDIGTACLRKNDFNADKFIYVVGNEQNYHFDVLKLILNKLGKTWADELFHLSYGMVELPEGKMKSREGKVVDADILIQEMIDTARKKTEELGKTEGFDDTQAEKLYHILAMGALKYFILKVDPKKNMIFNPEESIDFNGNTGPFIQYSYVRINSLMKKVKLSEINELDYSQILLDEKEKSLIKLTYDFPYVLNEAATLYSPALIANYLYELAKEFNQFYHDFPVLKESDKAKAYFRIELSSCVGDILKTGLKLLGIEVPDKM